MAEPVSVEQIRQHLDVARDDQDDLLAAMGVVAREWVEAYTGLTLTRREVTEVFASLDRLRTLAAWPIAPDAVPIVRHAAPGAAPTSLAGATVFPFLRPCPIHPAAGSRWPMGDDAVIVTIMAGYEPAAVPASLKAAILLLVGNLYANRETTITGTIIGDTGTIEMLCRPHRLPVIG